MKLFLKTRNCIITTRWGFGLAAIFIKEANGLGAKEFKNDLLTPKQLILMSPRYTTDEKNIHREKLTYIHASMRPISNLRPKHYRFARMATYGEQAAETVLYIIALGDSVKRPHMLPYYSLYFMSQKLSIFTISLFCRGFLGLACSQSICEYWSNREVVAEVMTCRCYEQQIYINPRIWIVAGGTQGWDDSVSILRIVIYWVVWMKTFRYIKISRSSYNRALLRYR